MAVTYIGNCEFEQIGPRVWSIDSVGLDTLTEQVKGRADKLEEYIAQIGLNAFHPTYRGMALRRISNDGDLVFPTVTVEFAGFRSGSPRAPIYRSGMSLQTVQSSATINGVGKCTIEAQFYAPTGETEWWEIGEEPNPDVPKFASVKTQKTNLVNYLVRFRITDSNGATANSVALSDVVAALNSLQNITVIQDYSYEPVVANVIWHCRSNVLKTLQGT